MGRWVDHHPGGTNWSFSLLPALALPLALPLPTPQPPYALFVGLAAGALPSAGVAAMPDVWVMWVVWVVRQPASHPSVRHAEHMRGIGAAAGREVATAPADRRSGRGRVASTHRRMLEPCCSVSFVPEAIAGAAHTGRHSSPSFPWPYAESGSAGRVFSLIQRRAPAHWAQARQRRNADTCGMLCESAELGATGEASMGTRHGGTIHHSIVVGGNDRGPQDSVEYVTRHFSDQSHSWHPVLDGH